MRFDLIPHIGAGKIKFGMTKEEVQSILGKPSYSSEKSVNDYGSFSQSIPAKVGYFANELQITFDDNNNVNYIEFSGYGAAHVKVFLNELEIFTIPAPKLIQEISQATKTHYDKENVEIPYSYIFPEINLSLWRQNLPELDEQTEEIPESDGGKYFWTVGIGIKGYY